MYQKNKLNFVNGFMVIIILLLSILFLKDSLNGIISKLDSIEEAGKITSLNIKSLNEKQLSVPLFSQDEILRKSEDTFWLAFVMYFEARNQPNIGKEMVAWTIVNRVNDGRFPNTIREVILEDKQFGFIWDSIKDIPKNTEAWNECIQLSSRIITGEIPNDSNGVTFFHNTKSKPFWIKEKTYMFTINDHKFYTWKK